ncbi:MAG TPA: CHASE3 domain-containing protein, partial [Bacteroidia bacterium]
VNQRLSDQVIKNTSYISNSESVIRNSNILHKDMIEMQSGFRGFLLTGQETFLQPFYEGIESVPPLFKEQRSLVTSEKQKAKLDSINSLHEKWLEYANGLIFTKLDTLPEAGKKYQELFETKLKMEVGKKINDQIQKIFQAFDNFEYGLRQERRAALQKSIEHTRNITLILTAFSIILALSSSIYIIRLVTKRISKMVTFAENISKGNFKPMEDDKKDELNNLSESLNKMSRTLERNFLDLTLKNKELDQFAYVVSHDLKAPLRGISNIISWVEEDHANDLLPEVKYNMGLIKGRTERLENMINGLLEYARIGKIKKGVEEVNTAVLVREIADILVPPNFKFRMEGEFPTFTVEKIHVEQIFSNLISNSVKYNNNYEPEIIVCSEESNDSYKFSVIDNGIGIQAEYFDKIFVIFQTLQERDAFESTGVGLAIVKKIIDDYKGTITVESAFGNGSTFIFTWPKEKI